MLEDEFLLGTKLYHKKFKELCKYIDSYLGTTNATYFNVDKNGGMIDISTNLKWTEGFIDNQYYVIDSLRVAPKNIHNGFAMDMANEQQEYKDKIVYDAVVKFDWCNSFGFIEKNPTGGYFGFNFGTTKDNYQIVNSLVNESSLVRKHIVALHQKILAIPDIESLRMDFARFKGDLFYSQQGAVFNEEHVNKRKTKLLKEVHSFSKSEDLSFLIDIVLSPQEINTLRHYLTERNIKRVALNLDLAVSTVASYIENVKQKLRCHHKNELFARGEILGSLGRI